MMAVQPQHSANFERTDEVLNSIRVLITSLEVADEAAPPRERADQYSNAVHGLIRMIGEKLEELNTTRRMEWVGLGGNSPFLTDDERAAALAQERE